MHQVKFSNPSMVHIHLYNSVQLVFQIVSIGKQQDFIDFSKKHTLDFPPLLEKGLSTLFNHSQEIPID